jgi:hypothetical protein
LNDGKITGTTTAIKNDGDNNDATWADCANTEMTGLAVGSYQVATAPGNKTFRNTEGDV